MLEDIAILNSRFGGFFVKSFNEVWLEWYITGSGGEVFTTLIVWCIYATLALMVIIKSLSVVIGTSSLFKGKIITLLFCYLGFTRSGDIAGIFFVVVYTLGLLAMTIYYMLGYTL